MRLLAAAVMDVSIVLLVALAAVAALRRHSAALRHWILTVAITCALAAPLLELGLPAWRLPAELPGGPHHRLAGDACRVRVGRRGRRAGVTGGEPASGWTPDAATLQVVLLSVWGIGASAALLLLLTRLAHLKRLSRRVEPVDDPRWLGLLQAIARAHGVSRRVDLGAESESRHGRHLGAVPAAHRRPHLRLDRCAHPRGPLARARPRAPQRLGSADRGRRSPVAVLVPPAGVDGRPHASPRGRARVRRPRTESRGRRTRYAGHLLAVARAASSLRAESAAAAIARPSTLEERIRAMLNVRLNRDPLTRRGRIAAVLAVALVALAAADRRRPARRRNRASARFPPSSTTRPAAFCQAWR